MSPEQRAKTICTILEADTCAHLEGDDWATLERLIVEQIKEAEDAAYERAAGWRDISSAPYGKWIITCREGEDGINLCMRSDDDEWHDQSGRSTVTHHSMAAPTHWAPCKRPPALKSQEP